LDPPIAGNHRQAVKAAAAKMNGTVAKTKVRPTMTVTRKRWKTAWATSIPWNPPRSLVMLDPGPMPCSAATAQQDAGLTSKSR
jgi:hypothetical protein